MVIHGIEATCASPNGIEAKCASPRWRPNPEIDWHRDRYPRDMINPAGRNHVIRQRSPSSNAIRINTRADVQYHDIFSTVLYQSKFNIFNYEYMNEVCIVFFPCLFHRSKKIHRQLSLKSFVLPLHIFLSCVTTVNTSSLVSAPIK